MLNHGYLIATHALNAACNTAYYSLLQACGFCDGFRACSSGLGHDTKWEACDPSCTGLKAPCKLCKCKMCAQCAITESAVSVPCDSGITGDSQSTSCINGACSMAFRDAHCQMCSCKVQERLDYHTHYASMLLTMLLPMLSHLALFSRFQGCSFCDGYGMDILPPPPPSAACFSMEPDDTTFRTCDSSCKLASSLLRDQAARRMPCLTAPPLSHCIICLTYSVTAFSLRVQIAHCASAKDALSAWTPPCHVHPRTLVTRASRFARKCAISQISQEI